MLGWAVRDAGPVVDVREAAPAVADRLRPNMRWVQMSAKELIFSVLQKPSLVYPQISYGDQKRVFRWLDSYRI
jgi:hypothetical protein